MKPYDVIVYQTDEDKKSRSVHVDLKLDKVAFKLNGKIPNAVKREELTPEMQKLHDELMEIISHPSECSFVTLLLDGLHLKAKEDKDGHQQEM